MSGMVTMIIKWIAIYISILVITTPAYAGVVLGGTRLVYDTSKKEAALSLKNTEADNIFLIQSWVDNYDQSVKTDVPFVIIPPLFRLDKAKEGLIRVKSVPNNLPQDRESIFLLNVKAIAAEDKIMATNNKLQVSIVSRIKLFYRPANLAINSGEVSKMLTVSKEGDKVKITNPTPYYVTFYKLKFNDKEKENIAMMTPFSHRAYEITEPLHHVRWQLINDYGGITKEVSQALNQ